MSHLISGRIYNRRKQSLGGQTPKGVPQIEAPVPTSSIVASELGVSKATIERKKTIQDLYLKCYTAEEIGAAVGLEKVQANELLSSVSEDIRKANKVTFSEPDYAPPIYQAERKEPPC